MPHIPDEPEEGFLSYVIPFEYSTAIGDVVSKWALLEHEIDWMIWSLAGLVENAKIGACLTAQYSSVAARFNAMFALARLRGVPEFQIAKLNKFRDQVFGLAERRNRVAHDPWFANWDFKSTPARQTATYRLHKTARSKLEYTLKPIEMEELKALSEAIDQAMRDFDAIEISTSIEPYEIR
jgi:hypothetical protein